MEITQKLNIEAQPKKVYHALSSQIGVTGWWSKDCTISDFEGGNSTLKFNKEGNFVEMGFKTITLEPNNKVVWECISNPNPAWLGTKITTQIINNENHCKILFSHSGFNKKWEGQDPFEMTKMGWKHFIKSLKSYCETGEGQPW